MSKLDELTLITCSYNTPEHLITMLRSFVKIHGDGPFNIVIMENSTNGDTAKLLDGFNIEYIVNKGSTHSPAVDKALLYVRTRFALLVDSDVVFRQDVTKLIDVMKINNGALLGEICGDRGGYQLYKRVHPWFCLIDVDQIRAKHICFHDQKRIADTGSTAFYQNIPINPVKRNIVKFYDVGSTFYEDINKAGLKVIEAKGIQKYYEHFEGSSWHRQSDHKGFNELGRQMYEKFCAAKTDFDGVDTTGKFILRKSIEDDTKLLIVSPIFCPNDEVFEANRRSILSTLDYLKHTHFFNAKIVFAGWCSEDKYWLSLSNAVADSIGSLPCAGVSTEIVHKFNWSLGIELRRIPKNYGKAFVVNKVLDEYSPNDYPYFISQDSDIVWDHREYDNIRRLIRTASLIPESFKAPLGFLALDQKGGASCHLYKMFNQSRLVGSEVVKWSSNYAGIAGGALFISHKSFKEVGGYREMGVYSGDDGFLLSDFHSRGFVNVLTEIAISHVSFNHLDSGRYLGWKRKVLEDCRNNSGKPLSREQMERQADHVEKLWREGFPKGSVLKQSDTAFMPDNAVPKL